MLVGKTVDEFKFEGKEAVIRYEEMEDAEGFKELRNSLVEEKALIGSQDKVSEEEAVDKVSGALKEIEKNTAVYLFLEVGDEVAGSCGVRKEGDGAQDHVGTCGVFIKKDWRNKGLGTKLMRTVISEVKERLDIKIILLEAFENNEPAINLYKKLGFKEAGRVKDGLKDPDGNLKDRIIFQKKLE